MKVHDKTLKNHKITLFYKFFEIPLYIIDRVSDNLYITTVSKAGDVNLFRWNPQGKGFSGEVWNFHLKTAYDEITIRFGVFQGKLPEKGSNPMEHYLVDVMEDRQAISPKDKDGFLQLRPNSGVTLGYTGAINHKIGEREGHIEIKSSRERPDCELRANRIKRDDEDALLLIHLLSLIGERVNVEYTDYPPVLYTDRYCDDLFDLDYPNFGVDAYRTIGPTVDAMLDEMSDIMGFDRKLQNSYYKYLMSMFRDLESYDNGHRFYHYSVYSAIYDQ